MTHAELTTQLLADGFTRVERDDRLLDIFPMQIREKGIELWERWSPDIVDIVRIRLPYHEKRVEQLAISRQKIETALLDHHGVQL